MRLAGGEPGVSRGCQGTCCGSQEAIDQGEGGLEVSGAQYRSGHPAQPTCQDKDPAQNSQDRQLHGRQGGWLHQFLRREATGDQSACQCYQSSQSKHDRGPSEVHEAVSQG